jgi:hypothetical protein
MIICDLCGKTRGCLQKEIVERAMAIETHVRFVGRLSRDRTYDLSIEVP